MQYKQNLSDNYLSDKSDDEHKTKTATKAAELFNTNRTYIHETASAFIYIAASAPQNETISISARISICVKVRSSRVGHLRELENKKAQVKMTQALYLDSVGAVLMDRGGKLCPYLPVPAGVFFDRRHNRLVAVDFLLLQGEKRFGLECGLGCVPKCEPRTSAQTRTRQL